MTHGIHADQAVVGEDRERLEHVAVDRDDLLDRRQRRTTDERRERREQRLLARCEQVVRPVQRRAQGALPLRQVGEPGGRQVQAPVEPVQQLRRGEQPDPCGRDLDRERHPLEPAAQLGRRRCAAPDPRRGRDRDEWPGPGPGTGVRRRTAPPTGRRSAGSTAGSENPSVSTGGPKSRGCQRVVVLRDEAKPAAARHEDRELRAGADERGEVARPRRGPARRCRAAAAATRARPPAIRGYVRTGSVQVLARGCT